MAAAQPQVSVTSIQGAAPGGAPFLRSELVSIGLTGADPFARLSLVMGSPVSPPVFDPIPGVVTGFLEVGPDLMPIPGFDGLGIFGAPSPFARADAAGSLALTFQVPPSCAFTLLDALKNVQAAVAQVPDPTMPNPAPIVLSSASPLQVIDPSGGFALGGFATDGANPRSFVEGVPTQVTLSGSFLPPTVAFPTVTFESLLDPGPVAVQATVLSVDAAGTSIVVQAPATIPASGPAPASAFGPIRVTVDYTASGVACDPMTGMVSAGVVASCDTPAGMLPADYLLYESTVTPTVTALSVKGSGINAPGPMLTVSGTDFMAGAEVVFQHQGTLLRTVLGGAAVTVASPTSLTVQAPTLALSGVHDVLVRNPDCHESPVNGALSEFVYFDLQSVTVASLMVNGGMPTLTESAGTFMLRIDGTAPVETGLSGTSYHPLDGAFGNTTVDLGSDLGPMAFVTVATTAPMVGVMGVPGAFRFDMITASATPPGLVMPPALTMNGVTNTGPKHVRLTPSATINPALVPHRTFAELSDPMTTPEPGNVVLFTAPVAPAISAFVPNNCVRVDGGQRLTIEGMDVLTNDAMLPSTDGAVGPRVELFDPLGTVPTTPAALDTIDLSGMTSRVTVTTPDFSALGLTLPYALQVRVTNPDGQSATSAGSVFLYPSLASASPADEVLVPVPMAGATTIDSTAGGPGGPAIVYTHVTVPDLVVPMGVTLSAQGEHPLIIRVRGDVTIAGTLDLSGGSVTGAPFFRPSGAGRGGAGEDPMNFGAALALGGRSGASVVDAATSDAMMALLVFAGGEGVGGTHDVGGSGGGGGAMATAGLAGVDGPAGAPVMGAGGMGGTLLPFMPALVLPVPPLAPAGMMPGAASFGEIWNPPGGCGGGAGGLGTAPPFNPASPPPASDVGLGGAGGNGGGGLAILADGVITVAATGRIVAGGQDGQGGMLNALAGANQFGGGGGGGGAGGGVLLQAIQGIVVEATMGNPDSLNVVGGAGGSGAAGTNSGTGGGGGGSGLIRYAVPLNSAVLMGGALQISGGAVVNGVQDTTGF